MLIGNKPIGTIAYMGGVMSLPEPFVWSWSQMLEYNQDYLASPAHSIYYYRATVSYHVYARNNIVDQMKGDWVLMLDTDISFEPDLAVRMITCMEKHKIDVLSGVYNFKSPPHAPLLFLFHKSGRIVPLGDWTPNAEIYEMGSAGAGCLMVRKKVFDRIKEKLNEGPFDVTHPMSEDHSFFDRLRRLKIKAYFNPNIEVHHLAYKHLKLEDYDKSRVRLSKKEPMLGFK